MGSERAVPLVVFTMGTVWIVEGSEVVDDEAVVVCCSSVLRFRLSTWLTMLAMLPGLLLRVTTVVTPAAVARRAATILVPMPPVPREEPALETSAASSEMSSTTSIALASGFVRGFLS